MPAASWQHSNARDSHHDEALAILASLRRQRRPLLTSNFVIAESHALRLAKTTQAATTLFLREADASEIVVERVSEADERLARDIIYRYPDKRFSLTDATSFALMERLDISQAFTFDSNFIQYGFQTSQP